MKTSSIRALTAALVFAAVGVGLALHTGSGTISSFGWEAIATICPLGGLEAMLGAWAFIPRVAIYLAAVALIVLVAGKAFCSWICPVPHVKNLFSSKKAKAREEQERAQAAAYALDNWRKGAEPEKKRASFDSRHGVLLGALLSSAIFGFPVFCLVCPIGLTIGTFIMFWRLVQFNEPTWGLVAFPVIVILEVVVFRRWCGTICPMGALISLISKGNRTFKPTVDHGRCLRDTQGAACQACGRACPEQIDPYANVGKRDMQECIKCAGCAQGCPVKAISFPFLPRNHEDQV